MDSISSVDGYSVDELAFQAIAGDSDTISPIELTTFANDVASAMNLDCGTDKKLAQTDSSCCDYYYICYDFWYYYFCYWSWYCY